MSTNFRDSALAPLVYCLVAYGLAFAVAVVTWRALPDADPLLRTFYADVAGTLVIFISGTIVRNSSMYDPYWSVGPIVIGAVWLSFAATGDEALRAWLALGLVALWGLRLTYNCFRRWTDMSHEDFRYQDFRAKWGRHYWFVDLFGIQLLPTTLVFLACLPLWPAMTIMEHPLGWLDILAVIVTLGAIIIETVADENLQTFLKSDPPKGAVCKVGLWQYSRHPNYFGEIMFWWGLYLFALAIDPAWWWTGIGALAITLLFVFASVPMMEVRKREKRPDYDEQVKGISKIIPLPVRKG